MFAASVKNNAGVNFVMDGVSYHGTNESAQINVSLNLQLDAGTKKIYPISGSGTKVITFSYEVWRSR